MGLHVTFSWTIKTHHSTLAKQHTRTHLTVYISPALLQDPEIRCARAWVPLPCSLGLLHETQCWANKSPGQVHDHTGSYSYNRRSPHQHWPCQLAELLQYHAVQSHPGNRRPTEMLSPNQMHLRAMGECTPPHRIGKNYICQLEAPVLAALASTGPYFPPLLLQTSNAVLSQCWPLAAPPAVQVLKQIVKIATLMRCHKL